MSEDEVARPERKTREMGDGETLYEAHDCRFISSPAGTVHERAEWPGTEYDYEYHPKCGQTLPPESMWSWVDADSAESAVVGYDLKPCQKCFSNACELRRKRRGEHSNIVTDGGRPEPVGDLSVEREQASVKLVFSDGTDSEGKYLTPEQASKVAWWLNQAAADAKRWELSEVSD